MIFKASSFNNYRAIGFITDSAGLSIGLFKWFIEISWHDDTEEK